MPEPGIKTLVVENDRKGNLTGLRGPFGWFPVRGEGSKENPYYCPIFNTQTDAFMATVITYVTCVLGEECYVYGRHKDEYVRPGTVLPFAIFSEVDNDPQDGAPELIALGSCNFDTILAASFPIAMCARYLESPDPPGDHSAVTVENLPIMVSLVTTASYEKRGDMN